MRCWPRRVSGTVLPSSGSRRSAAVPRCLPPRSRPKCASGRISCATGTSAWSNRENKSMSPSQRQMHLGVFVLGTRNHSAGWRMDGAFTTSCTIQVMQSIATIAERGKFDLFFISDSSVMDAGDHPSFLNRFEPMTLLSALGMLTMHIGLGATVSTSFNEPFNVARGFASLDHLSAGRAAWNGVTRPNKTAAPHYGKGRHQHDLAAEVPPQIVGVGRGR